MMSSRKERLKLERERRAEAEAAAEAADAAEALGNGGPAPSAEGGDGDGGGEREGPAMSRKERMRLEKKAKADAENALMSRDGDAQSGVVRRGGGPDCPFTVSAETQAVGDAVRDISISKVSVSIRGKQLFRDTDVKFCAGSRYGLMGPNGRGKSTLLRLLADRVLPVPRNLSLLLVGQEQECEDLSRSAVDAVVQSHAAMLALQQELAALGEKSDAALTDADLDRLGFIEEELLLMGADSAEARARRILFGLGFPTEWHDRPVGSFSGGWRKRVALASAVFIEPGVLMLDEPTNHLDLNAVLWLDQYLVERYGGGGAEGGDGGGGAAAASGNKRRQKCLIVVSHDAGFLDSVCTHMAHIEFCRLHFFSGGYAAYAGHLEAAHAAFDKQHEAFQKLLAEKKRKGGLSNEKAEAWARGEISSGRVPEGILDKRREYKVSFPFRDPPALRTSSICEFQDVSFAYPSSSSSSTSTSAPAAPLFTDVNVGLWSDSRVALCGPNGVGKTTLLDLITGALTPTEGHVTLSRQARVGRYTQHFVDSLPLSESPLSCIIRLGHSGFDTEATVRRLLGSFGLEGTAHKQLIGTLSGGQKARVAFAVIAAGTPHFLVLDEPTNHLDVEAIEALCAAINGFSGGVLVVTHDARLIERTDMRLWVMGGGAVVPFGGDLAAYRAHVRRLVEAEDARLRSAVAARRAQKSVVGVKDAAAKIRTARASAAKK